MSRNKFNERNKATIYKFTPVYLIAVYQMIVKKTPRPIEQSETSHAYHIISDYAMSRQARHDRQLDSV